MKKHLLLIGLGCFLGSCAGKGPPPVLTQVGVPAPPAGTQYPNVNPLLGFRAAAADAESQRTPGSYKTFMRSGFALVYVRCNEFFDGKGTDQANANLIRGSIAPIAALVSGIMALHSYKTTESAEHDLALLTLGTNTSIAILDVYSQHFLFGADNVDSVREMVKEELSTHANEALKLEPANIEEAAMQIVDHQTICTPAHILKSVRASIANGKFDAAISGEGNPNGKGASLDEIGTALSLNPPTITASQAVYLYAITYGMAHSEIRQALVYKQLSDLPEAANPVTKNADGTYQTKSGYPFSAIKAAFEKLSPVAQQYLNSQASALMASVGTGQMAAAGSGAQKAFLSQLGQTGAEFQVPGSDDGELRRVRVEPR